MNKLFDVEPKKRDYSLVEIILLKNTHLLLAMESVIEF